jgi:hypothetical protein
MRPAALKGSLPGLAAAAAALGTLDRRILRLLLGALLVFVALECWFLLLRAPLDEWRLLTAQSQVTVVPMAALRAEVEHNRRALAQAEQALRAADLPQDDDERVLQLIAILDRVAQSHHVRLGQVKAGGRQAHNEHIQTVTFDAEARGDYLDLVAWLAEVEPQIAPLVATELQLSSPGTGGNGAVGGSGGDGQALTLRVRLNAHVPIFAASDPTAKIVAANVPGLPGVSR